MSDPTIQEAITDLAKLGHYWALMADTQPEAFLREVKAEIVRLREEREAFYKITKKLARFSANDFALLGPLGFLEMVQQARMTMEELGDTSYLNEKGK